MRDQERFGRASGASGISDQAATISPGARDFLHRKLGSACGFKGAPGPGANAGARDQVRFEGASGASGISERVYTMISAAGRPAKSKDDAER